MHHTEPTELFCSPFYPAHSRLDLTLNDGPPASVTILRAVAPCTLSPVLLVRNDTISSLPAEMVMVLKLYDRRFLTDMREVDDIGRPWSETKEAAYRAFLDSGASMPDPKQPYDAEEDEEVDEGRYEAYLANVAELFHRNEVDAYARLADLQGHQLPRCYGDVTLSDGVKGILLEYISPSCTLRAMPTLSLGFTREQIPAICDEAVSLVTTVLHDRQMLHTDMRLENILLHLTTPPRLVLIDLASCTPRTDETDREWYVRKARQDEEGAIGVTLAQLIRRWKGMEGAWEYHDSCRYKLTEDDDD